MPSVYGSVFGESVGETVTVTNTVTQFLDPRAAYPNETFTDDSAALFADLLDEWPAGRLGMEYHGTKRDVVKSMANPSFEMEGNNYNRNMDCEALCLRSSNLDLIEDWKVSSKNKRPIVTLLGEKFQAMEMQDEESAACVKFTCRLLQ